MVTVTVVPGRRFSTGIVSDAWLRQSNFGAMEVVVDLEIRCGRTWEVKGMELSKAL